MGDYLIAINGTSAFKGKELIIKDSRQSRYCNTAVPYNDDVICLA